MNNTREAQSGTAETDKKEPANPFWLPREELQDLLSHLQNDGFDVIGPTACDGAIVYRKLASVTELPAGWTDQQGPASYQLVSDPNGRLFDHNSSPDSFKRTIYPPRQRLSGATLTDEGWQFSDELEPPPKQAILGVHACDVAAIAIQDRVFLEGDFVDPVYESRRAALLIIAVECSRSVATCFCTSMDTGPEVRSAFDLSLTELDDGFVVRSGSEAGQKIVQSMKLANATENQRSSREESLRQTRESITKRLETDGLHDSLMQNLDHPHWNQVAERCLSCGNCTMVCPTCFCSTVQDVSDLDQTQVTRVRQWDSCFNPDFSYTASGSVRHDIRSRYRQWLTHKLATWQDQFDTSGCTGCGRCITWCPVGIDLTEEVAAIAGKRP
ncbi:MAG: 4Fe-4S dicluster domain-containing protein [Planctomycetota bacterium]